jgi:DnaJ-class molecular chaperone
MKSLGEKLDERDDRILREYLDTYPVHDNDTCQFCGGRGMVFNKSANQLDDCPYCFGTGHIIGGKK